MRKLHLETVILVVGILISLSLSLSRYFFSPSPDVSNALILGLIALNLTLILNVIFKLFELKKYAEEHIAYLQIESKILEGKLDKIFIDKYHDLKEKMR
jgi:hypothetical protein